MGDRDKTFKIPKHLVGRPVDSESFVTWVEKKKMEGWKFIQKGNEHCLFENIETINVTHEGGSEL